MRDEATRVYVNPTGRFVIGGPKGDAGLTGRKIIADTYGGMARHGGGAFSGKDPDQGRPLGGVRRALRCQERRRGRARRPLRSAGRLRDRRRASGERAGRNVRHRQIARRADRGGRQKDFDLRPAAIIHNLDLRRPIYRQTAAYGHFGRPDLDLPWERLDKVDALRVGSRAWAT